MSFRATAIPEKIFFKIGEVCDIVGVEAHVLRYWETEFPQLSPQKNRSGQRAYRKRDVETALRIKELLYEDLYTIAGAKKRLAADLRETGKPHLKVVSNNDLPRPEAQPAPPIAPVSSNYASPNFEEADDEDFSEDAAQNSHSYELTEERKAAIQNLAKQMLEMRQLLARKIEIPPRKRW